MSLTFKVIIKDVQHGPAFVLNYDNFNIQVYLIRARASAELRRCPTAFDDFINAFRYADTERQTFEVCEHIVRFLYRLPNELCKYLALYIPRTLMILLYSKL